MMNLAKHPTISLIEICTTLKQIKEIHSQLLINAHHKHRRHLLGHFVSAVALKHPDHLDYSNHLLAHFQYPTIFALNSMIRAHSRSSTPNRCFDYYHQILQSDNLKFDNYTFTFLVRACAQILSHHTGSAVHAAVIKHGFESVYHVRCALIHMYGEMGFLDCSYKLFLDTPDHDAVVSTMMISASVKLGEVDYARNMFDNMPNRDLVAWNAMINGYVKCGRSVEALNLFHLMQLESVEVNENTMVSVISACSQLGAIEQGRLAHDYIERNRLDMTVTLGSALVDMYAKCGDIGKAMEFFWGMKERNVYTWSCALGGLAMNGAGKECLMLFSVMKEDSVQPNEITFISVLRACSVAGLVEEGWKHFESMKHVYGLEPLPEHYGCMVDLYGRAGRLDDALEFINNMPMKPHAGAWIALLSACKTHGNMRLAEIALLNLVELEGDTSAGFMLLSNIYSDSREWDRASEMKQLMVAKRINKVPGCSVIEVGGEVQEFYVGNKSHPRYAEIEVMLDEISRRLRLSGYVANTKPVLFDIDEEEKEYALRRHCEKVAVAFGLVSLDHGAPIRIVTNLRTCADCHDVIKAVSKVFNREIVVRDVNRFHHFRDGRCSCGDYW